MGEGGFFAAARVLGEEGDGEGHEGADGAAAVVVGVAVAVVAVASVAGAVVAAHPLMYLCIGFGGMRVAGG